MPTPKPGQIRCPNCLRPTPMAAFCTQCGAAIPSDVQVRPRGMDREELDARIRQRRPGDARLRRGTPIDGEQVPGYVPFAPEPDDARALREPTEPAPRVDNLPFEAERQPPPAHPPSPAPAPPIWPEQEPTAWREPERAAVPTPVRDWESDGDPYGGTDESFAYADAEPADDYPDEYAEDYADDGDYAAPVSRYGGRPPRRRGGSGALPIIGFAALAILALGVGAALAGMLGGGGVAQTTATPLPTESAVASVEPTVEPTATEGTESGSPEPTDGPVTFPDGAVITVQPCATQDMNFDGCVVDGSTISEPTMWVWVGFDDAAASDVFTLTLRSEGQTIDQQQQELGAILDCPGTCSGYLIGAAYRDLGPGEYELVVRRNDEFADSATFTVEG